MSPKEEYDQIIASLPALKVKIVNKADSWFWKVLGGLVYAVTFGKNNTFNDSFTTTLGHTIAVPKKWNNYSDLQRLSTLTHEFVHVKQCEKYSTFLMVFAYLLLPLPLGLAYCRYRFERVAYAAGIKKHLEHDLSPASKEVLILNAVNNLTAGSYAWTWPFPKSIRAWFDQNV